MHFYYGTFPFANEKGATKGLQKKQQKNQVVKKKGRKKKGKWGGGVRLGCWKPDSSQCVLDGRGGIWGDKDRKGNRSEWSIKASTFCHLALVFGGV